LNWYHAAANDAISRIEEYVEHKTCSNEAQFMLGQLADRLAALGFEASDKQLPPHESAYTISNQLGE